MPAVPVDYDPFAQLNADTPDAPAAALVPVDHDPFAKPSVAETARGLDKQLAAGAIEGASLAAFPPSTANFLERGADWLWNKVMPAGPAGPRPEGIFAPGGLSAAAAAPIQQGLDAVTAQAGDPNAIPGGPAARRVGNYVGGGVVGGVSPIRSLMGAGGDIAAGELTKGTQFETPARIAAGILASSGPKSFSPFPMSPERTAAVQTLKNAGVPVLAGEATGNPFLRGLETALGDIPGAGGRPAAVKGEQGTALANEVMSRAGSSGLATKPNVQAAKENLQKTFDDITSRNSLKVDPELGQDIMRVADNYDKAISTPDQKSLVYKEISKLLNVEGDSMPGAHYQAWRSRLGNAARDLYGKDSASAEAYKGLQRSLDSAFARSVNDPADAALLQKTNAQYAAAKGLEKIVENSPTVAQEGMLGPQDLKNMYRGKGGYKNIGELADAASILKPLPNSGTGRQVAFMNTLGGLGLSTYQALHGQMPLGFLASQVAAPVVARGLFSPLAQRILMNQRYAGNDIQGRLSGALPVLAANPGLLSRLPWQEQ